MGAARYVGRIGGLAVALGVGAAVATGYGLASADPTDPNQTEPDATSAPSPPTAPDTPGTTPKSGPTTAPSPSAVTQAPSASGAPSDTSSTSTGPLLAPGGAGVVTSSGGAQSTAGTTLPTATLPPVAIDPPAQEEQEVSRTGDRDADGETVMSSTAVAPPGKSSLESAYDTTFDSKVDTVDRTVDRLQASTFSASTAVAPLAVAPMSAAAVDGVPVADKSGSSATLVAPNVTPTTQATTTAIVPRVVTGLLALFGLGPLAATNAPVAPAEPPALWGVFAWMRREIEHGFANLFKTPATGNTPVPTGPAELSLATAAAPTALAAAAAAAPGFPVPGQQLSPSTNFVNWLTGNYPVNNTLDRFAISGTDLGIMWDNGIPDNPNTPVNEHQVLIAFGDTFGNRFVPGEEWRNNTLFRSSDAVLSDGISVADGQYVGTGPESANIYAGSPLDRNQWLQFQRSFSKQVVPNPNLGPSITIIPTAGISVPRPGAPNNVMQVINFMAVQQWGSPGQWSTSYSALATSVDNGESWQVAPATVRYNQMWTGNQNFQQAAYVRPGDGFVYTYGTPNGRQGSAYVARVKEQDILDLTRYEYYSAGSPGFFGWGATPAGWIKNSPAAATAIMPPQGACPGAGAGNTVSELSVQYNSYLNKYVALYTDQTNNVVMRTSSTPQGTWSDAKVLMSQQPGGIYAPMMHPWSPSTLGTGTDLYWNLSNWNEYNVMLMRTDLTKV